MLSSYPYTFTGKELQNWFCKNQSMDENAAKQAIQQLLVNNTISKVTSTKTNDFAEAALYRHKPKRVVILGGGSAGIEVAKTLQKNSYYQVTLVDARDYFELAPMIPYLGTMYKDLQVIRKPYKQFLKQVTHVQSKAKSVTAQEVECENGTKIQDYDYLIISTGSSYIPLPLVPSATPATTPASTIIAIRDTDAFFKSLQTLSSAKQIAIVGAGATGVEIAGELASKYPQLQVSLIGSKKMYPDKVYASLPKNVQLVLDRANNVVHDQVQLASGKTIPAEIVYCCNGFVPNTQFLQNGIIPLTPKGFIPVDKKTLQVSGFAHIFAMGDVADLDAVKMNMFAADHSAIVSQNVDKVELRAKLAEYAHSQGRDVILQMVSSGTNASFAIKNSEIAMSFWGLRNFKAKMMSVILSAATK